MADGGRRLRVLWLIKGLGPGGAERLLVGFAQQADHGRFALHAAWLLPHKDHLVADLAAAGVALHPLDATHPADPRWLARLRRLVVDEGIDVVHGHSPLVTAQARLALRALPPRRRPALVSTEHNVWASHRRPTRLANRLTVRLDDHVFAVSEQVRASMGAAGGRAEVLVHGVDVDAIAARRGERAAARAELGLGDDQVAVVTVANLRATKDHATLLAAARLCVDRGLPLTFLSVGQGPLAADLAAEAARLDLGERFRFLGHRADPVRVLVAADVFCLSSRHEGLPVALLEAMSAGLPSVLTAVGGVASVVDDGVEAHLVPPASSSALALALGRLVDVHARTAMGQRAAVRSHAFPGAPAVARQQAVYLGVAPRASSVSARGNGDVNGV